MLPLWEGWDEYAHFAIVQHWADHASLPSTRDPLPREVDESMRLTPLAKELRWIGPPYLIHEQWWALPPVEREDRMRRLAAISPAEAQTAAVHPFVSYEAQQPPLYYWLLAAPMKVAQRLPIRLRAMLLRWLSMALGSLAIPLTALAARPRFPERSVVLCTALLAGAPGFAIDVSRIANDSAAIVLAALFLWLLTIDKRSAIAMGLTLGGALLAKAYLLALLPAIVVCWWRFKQKLALALTIALVSGGWWYAHNLIAGYGLSGWLDQRASANVFGGMTRIDWLAAANITAKSFTWFGAWSFLTLKSWMYWFVEAIAGTGAALALKRATPALREPAVMSGCYLAAIAFGVLIYYASHGIGNIPGWYLWPAAPAFAMIVTDGLRRASVLLILLLAVMDLYGGIAVMVPYYAGLVAWNHADGTQFFDALGRLGVPVSVALLWITATLAIPVLALRATDTP